MTRDRWDDSQRLTAFINQILAVPSIEKWVDDVKKMKKDDCYDIENNRDYYLAADLNKAIKLGKRLIQLSEISGEDLPSSEELGRSANKIRKKEYEDEDSYHR